MAGERHHIAPPAKWVLDYEKRSKYDKRRRPPPPEDTSMRGFAAFAAVVVFVTAAPAQDWAKAKLDKSPRHGEWVKVKHGNREVNSFVVYPEVKDKATAVRRHPRNLRPDRLGSQRRRRTGRGRLHRHRPGPAFRHGTKRRRHGLTRRAARRHAGNPRPAARPDHRRPERRGRLRHQAAGLQRQGGASAASAGAAARRSALRRTTRTSRRRSSSTAPARTRRPTSRGSPARSMASTAAMTIASTRPSRSRRS